MTQEEKIVQAANQYLDLKRNIEDVGDSVVHDKYNAFIAGVKSQAAKEYHTQGMYSKEDILKFLDTFTDAAPIEYIKNEFLKGNRI